MAEGIGIRRRGELAVTRDIVNHQREWLSEVRERVAGGEPFAVLSADAPHEIYRAMDIPYVVVQWWSSIIAAKQRAPKALAALKEAGYPDDREQYNALGLGELLLDEPAGAPWGGLPTPTIFQAPMATDGMRKLFELWARETGAAFYPIEHTIDPRPDLPTDWWERLPHHWDEFLPHERLRLMVEELTGLVRVLEETTGKTFSESRFIEVMTLANEQSEWSRRTRDLIAASVPVPVSAAETMTATMIPQWHRGSPWGRDAARGLFDEVAARHEAGQAACPDERIRLMWLGRALWSSLGFYQQFERRHGAVFVWSMYLGLAADAYLRYLDGRDPLRALAARFVPMGEEIRMPSWSAAWHLKEAKLHQVDGVVSFGEDDFFSSRLLEQAGIPVFSIAASNVDRRTWDEDSLSVALDEFIEVRVRPVAARRASS
jgi:hypothetical protein